MIKTIPKGTLLFRLTKDPKNDTRGVLLEDGTRCITPNFNVYFHPTPFSGHYMYKDYIEEMGNTVYVYKLVKDIKVVLLLEPSKYTRLDRIKKGIFLKPCSTVKKGCMPRKGKAYDTCLSDTIVQKYPNVVGMLGISVGDNKSFRENIAKGIRSKTMKMIKRAKDASNHSGVPELALYPLATRSDKDVIVKEDDKLDNNYKLIAQMNYNEDKLHSFMSNHAKYDENTNFYVYKS